MSTLAIPNTRSLDHLQPPNYRSPLPLLSPPPAQMSIRPAPSSIPKIQSLAGHTSGPVLSVGWSIDGRKLASGAKDESIRIWNPERADYAKASAELKGHTQRVNQLKWDPTHPERLASAGEDGTLRFWDIRQGLKPTSTVENPFKTSFLNLCWSPDAKLVAIGDSKDRLHFYEVSSGQKVGEHVENHRGFTTNEAEKDQINEVAFSHSGRTLFVPTGAGTVKAYDFELVGDQVVMTLAKTVDPHACVINCVDIDPRGRYLACGGADSIVSLVDLEGFYCAGTIAHLDSEVRSMSFSHDGALLALAGKDSVIDITSTNSLQQIRKLENPAGLVINSLAWHPGKPMLAWAGDDRFVRVVNLGLGA